VANPPATDQDGKPTVSLNRVDQAAILLMTLGEKSAAEILRHMGPKEVQRLGTAMAALNNVQQYEVEVVLNSFMEEVRTQTGLGMGADNYIRNMLVTALGEDKANGLIDRILLGGNTTGLDTLKWMEARSVADIIRNEHPQIQAIVLAYLDADQSAEVLAHFSEKVRLDVMMRVAALDTVQPGALQELNDILEKQFSGNAGSQTKEMGGFKTAAEIVPSVVSLWILFAKLMMIWAIKLPTSCLYLKILKMWTTGVFKRYCVKYRLMCLYSRLKVPMKPCRIRYSLTCLNERQNYYGTILKRKDRLRFQRWKVRRKKSLRLPAEWRMLAKLTWAAVAKKCCD